MRTWIVKLSVICSDLCTSVVDLNGISIITKNEKKKFSKLTR